MVRLNRLFGPAVLLWPILLGAQTGPQLVSILERLDRLERENRALTEEVRSLRAQIGQSDSVKTPGSDGETVPGTETANPITAPTTLEQKVDINDKRIQEQSQTKVEASQRFPIRLTG